MAATVDALILAPAAQALANSEVLDANTSSGGLQRIARCINTLYEQKRGALINDFRTANILSAAGVIAYYRNKVLGGSALTDELASVWFYMSTSITGGGNTLTVTVTQGVNTSTYTTALAIGAQWVQASDLILDDTFTEYRDITVEVTTLTNMTISLMGISIFYKRAKAVLTPLAGGYSNGVHPLETLSFGGEFFLSTVRLYHMSALLEDLYNSRVGMIISTRINGSISGATGAIFSGEVPPGVTEARFYIYTATADGSLEVTSSDDSASIGGGLALGWNGPFTVDVSPETEQTFQVFGVGSSIVSICGWWREASY